jgi:hypothetical protein
LAWLGLAAILFLAATTDDSEKERVSGSIVAPAGSGTSGTPPPPAGPPTPLFCSGEGGSARAQAPGADVVTHILAALNPSTGPFPCECKSRCWRRRTRRSRERVGQTGGCTQAAACWWHAPAHAPQYERRAGRRACDRPGGSSWQHMRVWSQPDAGRTEGRRATRTTPLPARLR